MSYLRDIVTFRAVGARDDYEEWARIAGDDDFSWKNIQKRLKDLETFHGELPEAYNELRSTAEDLVIGKERKNLTIITNAPVQRVLLEEKKAIGVESNGKKFFATKEVILSAGSLNDP
ncbi:hypothetical protein N7478_000275 [Penicillium angulare]|uniref:uncharacterized protein n=1 Tax=Penicillium angulare TaxID=116970 RepID=UPI00253FA5F0|nr:uncharacterized protein N7478_000275 [Penicillium angulare]KAJ5291024.1 hypothetical protein N7478_000275 [Penicillium angulare]